jgi:isopenicillin N synthase-like dioxygenase
MAKTLRIGELRRVPLVDLKGKPTDVAVEIGVSLQEYGFVTIVNHGVPAGVINRVYEAAGKVFNLPLHAKQQYETARNGRQTGYTSPKTERAQGEKLPDLKEFWHVMREGNALAPNLFPKEVLEFKDATLQLFQAYEHCGRHLLGHVGAFLGYEPLHFENMIANGDSVLRVLHYPPIQGDEVGVRAAPHTDINLFTLMKAEPGLEVETKDGKWISVEPPAEAIIANAGDMLQMHTFGRIRSTRHRVVNPPGKSSSRYSVPFFGHPRADVPLVTAGAFLQHRLREIGLKA